MRAGQYYLMDDLSIVCYTDTHSLFQVLGAAGVLTYALGIPLAFLGEAPSQPKVRQQSHPYGNG